MLARTILFVIVMAVYLWFPWNMIRQQERILRLGTPLKLALEPVDPYDAFRGRYIQLWYGQWRTPYADEAPQYSEVAWVTFRPDSLGFYRPDSIHQEPPLNRIAIRTTVSYTDTHTQEVILLTPESLRYYYLNDEIAPLAESTFRDLTIRPENHDKVNAYALVKVLGGEARIEEVYFQDVPVGEYVRAQMKEKE